MKSFTLSLMMLLVAAPALAADPTPEQLIATYDAAMAPDTYDGQAEMTSFREDGTQRTYAMRMLKAQDEKYRVWFTSPSSVKGQEILRSGQNMWVYLPNLKRATRIANRDSFQGGDFNNADILRVNYAKDYTAKLVPSTVADTWALELKAKNPDTAYDSIKLWVRKSDGLPVKGQYFGTSGQLQRSAEFSDYQELDKGYTRPTKVTMKNELVKTRRSELLFKSLKRNVEIPAQRFTQSDLGK
jgi:outer membrane lipoprotein-sorting protein